jgi:N-methylhydantoinase A
MINALRLVSIQRGYDPRDFALVAFGGAGPVHANRLAAETEIAAIIVPMSPGIFSAMGLLVTDLKHDYSSTLVRPASALDVEEVERTYQGLERRGREALEREGMTSDDISYRRSVDMRYVGQSYELSISLPSTPVVESTIADAVKRFHLEHDRAYGFSAPEEPVEIVNVRLTAVGRITKPAFRELVPRGGVDGGLAAARKALRPVYFAEAGGFTPCPILDRYLLAAADAVDGPAIIEEIDSTTVVHPGYRATVDRYGNLIVARIPQPDA